MTGDEIGQAIVTWRRRGSVAAVAAILLLSGCLASWFIDVPEALRWVLLTSGLVATGVLAVAVCRIEALQEDREDLLDRADWR